MRVADTPAAGGYRLFRREAMRAAEAPMKIITEYVHPAKLVRWGVV